ncbi:MAG TPA: VWA domain-containing protein [Urbifossiella sp.]|nr:VWA domain-containing protein [Urbifossiella sp.]
MFSFANPGFFWLAPLAALVPWWWLRRPRPALRYSDTRLFADLPRGRADRAKWGGALLRGLACLSLIIACAGPRSPDEQTRLPAEGIAIVLALDVSGSMGEADVAWSVGSPPISRLEAAKRSFALFVNGGEASGGIVFEPRISDQIGLVTFAALPETACPLTLNHSVLLQVASGLEPKAGLDAGTNVGDAIAEGLIRLEKGAGDRRKVLILLSDGEHNVSKEGASDPLKPLPAAQLAANLGIRVYTIDAGGEPALATTPELQEQRRSGREALRAVAAMTGGRSFAATSGSELLAAYQEISGLEKSPVESFQYRRYFEYYPWCAAAALALLLAAHLLERTRWRTVP